MQIATSNEWKEHPEWKPIFKDANSDAIIFYDHNSNVSNVHKAGAMWIPAVAIDGSDWEGHTYIAGATGSGKSYLINKILESDHHKNKRERFMFTDLKEKDESITSEYKKFGDKGIDSSYVGGHLEKSMFIFDDVTDPQAIQLRDRLIEKGRHRKATVVCVNHKLRDGPITRRPLNDSRYVITFPSANKGAVAGFMKDYMQMNKQDIQDGLRKVREERSRHLAFHMHHPNALATNESAWLI